MADITGSKLSNAELMEEHEKHGLKALVEISLAGCSIIVSGHRNTVERDPISIKRAPPNRDRRKWDTPFTAVMDTCCSAWGCSQHSCTSLLKEKLVRLIDAPARMLGIVVSVCGYEGTVILHEAIWL